MSRMATAEYIGAKRRAYLAAPKDKRRSLLSEVCETNGYEKKYGCSAKSGTGIAVCGMELLRDAA